MGSSIQVNDEYVKKLGGEIIMLYAVHDSYHYYYCYHYLLQFNNEMTITEQYVASP